MVPALLCPYAITLCGRLPIVLRVPLGASVTLLEATTPVQLPTKRGPPLGSLAEDSNAEPWAVQVEGGAGV